MRRASQNHTKTVRFPSGSHRASPSSRPSQPPHSSGRRSFLAALTALAAVPVTALLPAPRAVEGESLAALHAADVEAVLLHIWRDQSLTPTEWWMSRGEAERMGFVVTEEQPA